MLLLLLLIQTDDWSVSPAVATVGDTVVIERLIPLEGVEARARVAPLDASSSIQPLGPPEITYESGGIRIRHIVAGFSPGSVQVEMPDIELIHRDGQVDIVARGAATIFIGSILPAGQDSTPDPRPSQAPIGRDRTSLRFLVLLPLLMVSLSVGWGVWRRMRRPRPGWDPSGADAVEPPVDRWIQVGEHRAVAALAMDRLRQRLHRVVPETTSAMSVSELITELRERHPDWPVTSLRDALSSLERASFAPAVTSDVLGIVHTAEEALRELEHAAELEMSQPTVE